MNEFKKAEKQLKQNSSIEELKEKLIDEMLDSLESNPVMVEYLEILNRLLSTILPYCKHE